MRDPAPLSTIEFVPKWPRRAREYMLPWEESYLLTVLDKLKPKRMIEFGVNEGYTAKAVLEEIPSIEYYLGIDVPFGFKTPLESQRNEVPREPAHLVLGNPKFELIVRTTGNENAIIADSRPFDVAFIDGDHSYDGVMADYHLACRIVPKGGMVIFHDYRNAHADVTKALEDLHQFGHEITNIRGTMLAYEQMR